MKFSVLIWAALCAVASAAPATSSTSSVSAKISPTAVLVQAKQVVVEIPISRNTRFNKSFHLLYSNALAKRNRIVAAQEAEDEMIRRLARRENKIEERDVKSYALPDPVRRYAFVPPVQHGKSTSKTTSKSSTKTMSSSTKTTSTTKKPSTSTKTTSSTKSSSTSSSTSSTAPTKSSTTGVYYAVATNIAYDSAYLAPVVMGSQKQTMNVVYDTGSSDLWVFTTECSTCTSAKSNVFNPSSSGTYIKGTKSFSITYGDGSWAKGHNGSDIISIGGATIRQGIDITTSVSSNLLSADLDGILGLGFSALMSIQGTATIMQNLWNNNVIKQDMFGVQLIKFSDEYTGHDGGKWTFGGYDSSVIRGSLASATLIRQAWWQISVPSIKIGSVKTVTPTSSVIVDTGTTLIVLSKTDCDNIYSALPGGQLNSQYGVYTLWCNATSDAYAGRRNVYFNIGGTYFGVPAADLLWESIDNVNCYGAIQSWGSGSGISILGDVFLKNVYAVFDVGGNAVKIGQRTDVTALTD